MGLFKCQRKWVKQEKRIVKLMYRKGLIDHYLEMLSWGELTCLDSKRKNMFVYLPEIVYWTCDYWGEWDEHRLVDGVIDDIIWSDADYEELEGVYNPYGLIEKSKYIHLKSRKRFIEYLESLPTVRNDHKINWILKCTLNS